MVVFQAPLGTKKATNSPGSTRKEIPRTASTVL